MDPALTACASSYVLVDALQHIPSPSRYPRLGKPEAYKHIARQFKLGKSFQLILVLLHFL